MAFDLLSFLLGKSTGSGGGGGSAALGPKTIRQNGVYRAASDNLDGYNTVTVEVPNTYDAADEGKVVSNGALVAQTSRTITENGTYDTTTNDEVVVNVSGGGGFDADAWMEKTTFSPKTAVISANAPVVANGFRYTPFEIIRWEYTSSSELASRATVFAYNLYLKTFVAPYFTGRLSNSTTNFLQGCAALKTVDWNGDNIGNSMFSGCAVLDTLILRKPTVAGLYNTAAMGSAAYPFGANGTGGTLYVPSALISSYQSATNWSTILGYANNQILPIEGSIYENAYADGTPIAA